jgi:hypothetical protein
MGIWRIFDGSAQNHVNNGVDLAILAQNSQSESVTLSCWDIGLDR